MIFFYFPTKPFIISCTMVDFCKLLFYSVNHICNLSCWGNGQWLNDCPQSQNNKINVYKKTHKKTHQIVSNFLQTISDVPYSPYFGKTSAQKQHTSSPFSSSYFKKSFNAYPKSLPSG